MEELKMAFGSLQAETNGNFPYQKKVLWEKLPSIQIF